MSRTISSFLMEKLIVLFLIFFVFGFCLSQDLKLTVDTTFHSIQKSVQELSPGVYQVGKVKIFQDQHSIIFPAKVNMKRDLLEYLLVGETGKTHESLLSTIANAYHIQMGLLLLGLKGSNQNITEQGYSDIPKGDPVHIWITYKAGDESRISRAEKWILLKPSEKTMDETDWIFTGSYFYNQQFAAAQSQSFIAIFRDPDAIIDNPAPEGDNDEVWYVNEKVVPSVGADVQVIIKVAE